MSQSKAPSPAKSTSPEKAEPVKAAPRKRIFRPKTGGRFTGFDDYEPPTKRTKVEEAPAPMEDVQETMVSVAASQHPAAPATQTQTQTQRTRRSPGHETVQKEEQMDTMFPAAAKLRSQRGATRAPSASVEPEATAPAPKPLRKARASKPEPKDINVREQARLRVKEEDDRRRADEESLREGLNGIDIAQIRDITEIEDMELRPRADRATTRNSQADGERWNADWNGRKNFKKFRRRGAERGVQTHKVLVPFEEASLKKGFGVGDFLEDTQPSSTIRSRGSKRTQAEDSADDEPGFRAPRRSQTTEVINVEESEIESDEGPVVPKTQRSSGKTQRSSGRTQRVVETQVDTQTTTQRGKKRGATAEPAKEPASKRGRVGRRDDDSDEEETGFRFKRRG
jgi:hypothetical protein